MTTLFDPIRLGDLKLPNRIIMAPLTRSRAGASRIANPLMAEYYAQRASAGLIMTEATVVSPMGIGYAGTPGIWSPEQVEGWRLTTRAVHQAGGRIFLQLWHVGRISDPSFLDGALPVAPSAVAAKGIVEEFRKGAENAQLAGFDGVELHGANGYLLDQFLQDSTNLRTDDYGGPIENRARLMLEAVDAAISVWGAGRVGVHLAPRADAHSMGDSDLARTFDYVARRLGERKIAFICAREYAAPGSLGPRLKAAFGGAYIANEKFSYESAEQAVEAGEVDAVAFGKLFIANPDLPQRFALQAPLNEPKVPEFYAGGAHGYTDYPSLSAIQSSDLNNSHA